MKANPRQTMSYDDFHDSAQKKQPVRKGPVQEMINQYEDNIKRSGQKQSPAPSRSPRNLDDLYPFGSRPKTPAPVSDHKPRQSRIPTPKAKRNRTQTKQYDPSTGI